MKINDLFKDQDSFGQLLGKCLLFDRDSDYYKFSGFVTAALLDYDDPDKGISILAIDTRRPGEWYTFKYTREDLTKMFSNCIEVVGNSPEESFVFEK